MRCITMFWSTDRTHNGGTIHYNIIIYDTYRCVTTAYSIQYSNMLYRFVVAVAWMCSKVKGKGHPITGHEGPTGGVEV
jgi:hypothetical protein